VFSSHIFKSFSSENNPFLGNERWFKHGLFTCSFSRNFKKWILQLYLLCFWILWFVWLWNALTVTCSVFDVRVFWYHTELIWFRENVSFRKRLWILTHRPAMPFGNRKIYFRGSCKFSPLEDVHSLNLNQSIKQSVLSQCKKYDPYLETWNLIIYAFFKA